MPADDPIPSVDLAAYATISADIAEGDRLLAEILERRGLSESQWTEATMFWSRRMGEDVLVDPSGSVSAPTAMAFSEVFMQAQDEKKPLPNLSVVEWASLEYAVESASGDESLGEVLARRGLGLADYSRLVRYWAKTRASVPAQGRLYGAARALFVAAAAARSSEEPEEADASEERGPI